MKEIYLVEKSLGQMSYQSDKLRNKGEAIAESRIPFVCNCCMKNATDIHEVKYSVSKRYTTKKIQQTFRTKFPICQECKNCNKKNHMYVFLNNILSTMFGVISALLMRNYGFIVFGSVLVVIVSYLLMSLLIKPRKTEDNILCYDSVSLYKLYTAFTGAEIVVFAFTNKEYAKLYSDFNHSEVNKVEIHGSESAQNIWNVVQKPLQTLIVISVIVSLFSAVVYLANLGI